MMEIMNAAKKNYYWPIRHNMEKTKYMIMKRKIRN